MKNKLILIGVVVFLVGCNHKTPKNSGSTELKTELYNIPLPMCNSRNSKAIKDDGKTKLFGVWGSSINENASFRIQSDSIYYPEYFKSYKYTTKKDSIFIQYDGWIYKGIFRFRNDSLVLKTRNKENAYIRIAK